MLVAKRLWFTDLKSICFLRSYNLKKCCTLFLNFFCKIFKLFHILLLIYMLFESSSNFSFNTKFVSKTYEKRKFKTLLHHLATKIVAHLGLKNNCNVWKRNYQRFPFFVASSSSSGALGAQNFIQSRSCARTPSSLTCGRWQISFQLIFRPDLFATSYPSLQQVSRWSMPASTSASLDTWYGSLPLGIRLAKNGAGTIDAKYQGCLCPTNGPVQWNCRCVST